jgi:hypothetical protein
MRPRLEAAGQAARDLATAMDSLPWMKGRIYAHTDDMYGTYAARLWESGQPRGLIDAYFGMRLQNTPDGYAIAFIADDLLEDLRPSEKGLLIMISDGKPSYSGGAHHVKTVVDHYRRRGLRIVSVSIAPDLTAEVQRLMYGADVVEYDPNVGVFARNLAKVIGSSI